MGRKFVIFEKQFILFVSIRPLPGLGFLAQTESMIDAGHANTKVRLVIDCVACSSILNVTYFIVSVVGRLDL